MNNNAVACATPKKSILKSLGLFFNKHAAHIALSLCAVFLLTATVAYATTATTTVGTTTTADTMWNLIADEIKKWVTRLGGVAIFVGGVLFGLGWMQNDSREKIAGVSTIIAGGIVIAVAQLAGTFFA